MQNNVLGTDKKTVCRQNACNGCGACVEICRNKAIHITDTLCAQNAEINSDLCVHCNRCFSVCPNNSQPEFRQPEKWYQGWANQSEIRRTSSSGGIAAALSVAFVRQGGAVCSCARSEDGMFGFSFAETEEEAGKFTGSKYVKSSPYGVYDEINRRVKNHKPILFIGLPCQVAAVRNYVRRSDCLYTVDLICHGTPSVRLLNMYLEERGYPPARIQSMKFRENNRFYLSCDNKPVEPVGVYGRYTYSFLKGIDYTENCYSCAYAQIKRVSDLTIGDSWGSDLPADEQEKGISLILCQSKQGEKLLQFADLHLEAVDLNKAVSYNKQLSSPSVKPDSRNIFFDKLNKTDCFNKAAMQTFPRVFMRQNVKSVLLKMKAIFSK